VDVRLGASQTTRSPAGAAAVLFTVVPNSVCVRCARPVLMRVHTPLACRLIASSSW
jgi:hypothetical protein